MHVVCRLHSTCCDTNTTASPLCIQEMYMKHTHRYFAIVFSRWWKIRYDQNLSCTRSNVGAVQISSPLDAFTACDVMYVWYIFQTFHQREQSCLCNVKHAGIHFPIPCSENFLYTAPVNFANLVLRASSVRHCIFSSYRCRTSGI